jgi:dimethylamine monooxygenase subunit A
LNAAQGSAPTDPALFTKVLELLELAPRPFRSADHAWRELALGLQDDLVVMRLDQEQFVPEYMQVCFPTGWDPAQKYATDLRKIHEPVAEGERLQKSTFSIAQAMVHKGPFVRYVWTLAASNQLSQHPSEKIVPSAYTKQHTTSQNPTKNPINPINPIYLRVERQVTVPLPAWRRSLFLIRVFIAPIDSVANTVERKHLLCNSLKSMTPEVIAYKGIEPLMQQYFSENS